MFNNSKWITLQNEALTDESYLFRKCFFLESGVNKAVVNVCGLGYGVYSINGINVTEDVLSTPFTFYDKTVIYQSYDITALISEGENCIGAELGNGFYNNCCDGWNFSGAVWRDVPKIIMQIEIHYNNGEVYNVVTDSTWKCRKGAVVYNHMREGEVFDARNAVPGFGKAGFDDDGWQNAIICRGPGGRLKKMEMPPERVVRELKGVLLGNGIYDFGVNTSGWVKISATGEAGREISMFYSERLKDNLDIDTQNINAFNKNELKHCDKYIMSGIGKEEWEPRFVYHGFRYVKVVNAPQQFEIVAKQVHTDLQRVGSFECGDSMINKIHSASVQSTLTNFHSIPTDCPHREQIGWTADGHMSAGQALMNFDITQSYLKWLNDFRDSQRANGQLPSIVPTPRSGYRSWGGPGWESAAILIPYYIYKITGDTVAIVENWDMMKRYMEFLSSMAENYIIGYGLGDYCFPKQSEMCDVHITDTCFYYSDAVIMAECAAIMGENNEGYITLSQNIKKAYHKKFLESGIALNQTALACSIRFGLYDENEIPNAAKMLADAVIDNGYRIDCGILGTNSMFTALAENGYNEVLYKMVTNPQMPSYAYWMNKGMNTLCEDWDMTTSLNHHMFSEVDMWFYKYLAGIQLCKGDIVIKPCFLKEIGWVKAVHKDIRVEWDQKVLKVRTPKDATVVVNGIEHQVGKGEYEFNILQ